MNLKQKYILKKLSKRVYAVKVLYTAMVLWTVAFWDCTVLLYIGLFTELGCTECALWLKNKLCDIYSTYLNTSYSRVYKRHA